MAWLKKYWWVVALLILLYLWYKGSFASLGLPSS
jgi:hypothetical protein